MQGEGRRRATPRRLRCSLTVHALAGVRRVLEAAARRCARSQGCAWPRPRAAAGTLLAIGANDRPRVPRLRRRYAGAMLHCVRCSGAGGGHAACRPLRDLECKRRDRPSRVARAQRCDGDGRMSLKMGHAAARKLRCPSASRRLMGFGRMGYRCGRSTLGGSMPTRLTRGQWQAGQRGAASSAACGEESTPIGAAGVFGAGRVLRSASRSSLHAVA